jgi:hypothetical protein
MATMSAVWSQARDAGYGDNEQLMPISFHDQRNQLPAVWGPAPNLQHAFPNM